MTALFTRTGKVSGFFGKLAQRLYDARLAAAQRDVNRHRPFLGALKGHADDIGG